MNKAFTMATLATLITLTANLAVLAAEKVKVEPGAKSCRQFVQDFYNWYADNMNKASVAPSLEKVLSLKASSFSPELAVALKEDAVASAKVTDEIVGLDFDPILDTQSDVHKYTAGEANLKGANFLVPMFDNFEKKASVATVTAEVAYNNGHWIFKNFHYPKSNIPVNENLLSILKVLKAERDKSSPAKKHK